MQFKRTAFFVCVLSVSYCVDRSFRSDFLNRQKACYCGNRNRNGKDDQNLSRTKAKNRYEKTDVFTHCKIDIIGDQSRTEAGKYKVNHCDNEAFGKEDSEDVVTSRTDSTQDSDFLFFIRNTRCDEVGKQYRCEHCEEQTDPNENLRKSFDQ